MFNHVVRKIGIRINQRKLVNYTFNVRRVEATRFHYHSRCQSTRNVYFKRYKITRGLYAGKGE